MDVQPYLPLAIRACLRAGEEILSVYATDFSVEKKSDNSPLTLADQRAHEAIVNLLSETAFPVLSEEGKDIPYAERKSWERFWLVDPLDGTKEFVKRNGEFTVNIALMERRRPVLGVIFAPVKQALYFGGAGAGSFKADAGQPQPDLDALLHRSIRLPQAHPSKSRFTVVASRSHLTGETHEFIESLKKQYGEVETISAGSSLKICLVAEGLADVYPRFGPTMEWDTAAGQAIAEGAGKTLTDLRSGKAMMYNKESLRNENFMVR